MKREKIWGLIILVLVALAAVIVSNRPIRVGHTTIFGSHPPKYGLDIRGGVRAVLQAQTDKLPQGVQWNAPTAELVRTTLENRINASGVGEATVQYKPSDQFIIELPDVKNKNAVLQQLGTTAQMTFYYFRNVRYRMNPSPRTAGNPIIIDVDRDPKGRELYTFTDQRNGQTFHDGAFIRAAFNDLLGQGTGQRPGATAFTVAPPLASSVPPNTPIFFTPDQQKQAADLNRELQAWQAFIAGCPVILTGADIEPHCAAHLGGPLGTEPVVSQIFTPKGTRAFADFTRNHVGEINGVVLDDAVVTAPNINEPILDGQAEISGGFRTLAEAQALANLLNAGALPVPLQQVQVQSVEASLGNGAVAKSVNAGLVGLALVLLFMVFVYRLPGLLADIALCIYAVFTLAIFLGGLGWLGVPAVTLTLPGIAGFILSIGMAVDANILIFERLKEELRAGKSLRGAIDAGFRRAFTAIRDSNICTTITCLVLYTMGTASVRGFAVTLLIGVLVSLFSAITVTRTLLYLLVDFFPGLAKNPALFGVSPQSLAADAPTRPGLNIIGRRYWFYGLSALIIVPGLIFVALHGIKPSIEFTGGTQIEVKYDRPVSSASIDTALRNVGFDKSHIQMAEGGNVAIVSVQKQSSVPDPRFNPYHQQLVQALNTLGPNQELQFGNVGGVISRELTSRAIQAVVIASILITLYLATVFSIGGFVAGLRLGASAIAALLHDVLVLLGAFAIFGYFLGWEIDSLFVTAMLTVIGFSVHDTVVIFDRVRENLRHKQRGEPFEPLVNRSINQTLARSIFTSLTVLMTLLALIVLGGQTTRLLNVALFLGILSGTYSSIFNAAAILVDWENWLARRQGQLGPPSGGTGSRGAGAATLAANGGSARPITARPEPKTPALTKTATGPAKTTPTTDGNGVGMSGIRPKKKKPARRF